MKKFINNLLVKCNGWIRLFVRLFIAPKCNTGSRHSRPHTERHSCLYSSYTRALLDYNLGEYVWIDLGQDLTLLINYLTSP